MNVIIIDDIASDRELIKVFVDRYFHERQIMTLNIYEYDSGDAYINEIEKFKEDAAEPEIILLDCCMNGLDGIATANKIREYFTDAVIIFTTSSPDFAVDGYKVGAVGYLLKPIRYENFRNTLNRACPCPSADQIVLSFGQENKKLLISPADIVYCDIDSHYICFHTSDSYSKVAVGSFVKKRVTNDNEEEYSDNNIIRIRSSFKEVTDKLMKFPCFLACYHGCIVNMDYIVHADCSDFILRNGMHLSIRRRDSAELKKRFATYMINRARNE